VINNRFHKCKALQTLAQHTVGPPDAKWSFEAFFDHGRNANDTKCNKPITSKGLTPQKTVNVRKCHINNLNRLMDGNPPQSPLKKEGILELSSLSLPKRTEGDQLRIES